MNIHELQKTWNERGKADPLWAILSHPEKTNRRWDLEEFFQTGEKQINNVSGLFRQLDNTHRDENQSQ